MTLNLEALAWEVCPRDRPNGKAACSGQSLRWTALLHQPQGSLDFLEGYSVA
jgi:hypothetical protein